MSWTGAPVKFGILYELQMQKPWNGDSEFRTSHAALEQGELGTGRSITEQELGGFGIDPADSRPMWEEAVRMIPKMWTQETFTWEGDYFVVPPRKYPPKPIQKPHPPMWMARTQP